MLIDEKCETTLSWEQLRSPQISQFLVKPIQSRILSSHFSRATLYALLANCLQFKKEGQLNPGIVGVCNTRALLAELLAIRLLKDYSTRELIDALSYDFNPLSGEPQEVNGRLEGRGQAKQRPKRATARTSTLEVAIYTEAKKFLSHPLVVQQLQAIWAGAIVFHSAADSLHRYPAKPRISHGRHYGAMYSSVASPESSLPSHSAPQETIRRSVTLYDPSDASPFKLSRLRVPRYRQLASTMSFTVMLILFSMVLSNRSPEVTLLEVVFWFCSAGYMLDELVGFSEQGFGLYIASVWNAFDLGILCQFTIYYLLRLAGALVTSSYKEGVANMAYDVLATSAVLLFPRLFSFLDHTRYFSQLLIAFRLMARDLAALLVLIAITCSGFFMAFSLSFGEDSFGGGKVVYALFQIMMGFTPAAWDVWSDFNPLGKLILAFFLVIAHFLIVTILISVLTNSFTAVVKNANEEHQYLFAINTISAVKSDALFSYVAPANCFGLLLAPLRFLMPFQKYVLINRTIIKLTHWPVLFMIWAYEKIWLVGSGSEPVDHVERQGRSIQRLPTFALVGGPDPFTNTQRIKLPSTATHQKGRALDEVFRRRYHGGASLRKHQPSTERRKTVVDQWMNVVGDDGFVDPPAEQSRSVLEQLEEQRRPRLSRSTTSQVFDRRMRSGTRSIVSDPDERRSLSRSKYQAGPHGLSSLIDEPAEADDELNSIDDEHDQGTLQQGSDKENQPHPTLKKRSPSIKFRDPLQTNLAVRTSMLGASPGPATSSPPVTQSNLKRHNRESSTQTILFNPVAEESLATSPQRSSPRQGRRRLSRPTTALKTIPSASYVASEDAKNASKRALPSRPRPVMPSRFAPANKSSPNIIEFPRSNAATQQRVPSYDAIALDLASDIGDNRNIDPTLGILSSSFHTQMMRNADSFRRRNEAEDTGTMNRIMLSRMNNLEEGFKDILKEVKEWRNAGSRTASTGEDSTTVQAAARANRRAERKALKEQEKVRARESVASMRAKEMVPTAGEPGNASMQQSSEHMRGSGGVDRGHVKETTPPEDTPIENVEGKKTTEQKQQITTIPSHIKELTPPEDDRQNIHETNGA